MTMKTLLLIFSLFTAATLQAQEQQLAANTADRTPPVITEAKVEQDAQMAQQLRKNAKNEKQPVKEAQPKKEEDQRLSTVNTTSSAKKTSKKPGEQ